MNNNFNTSDVYEPPVAVFSDWGDDEGPMIKNSVEPGETETSNPGELPII